MPKETKTITCGPGRKSDAWPKWRRDAEPAFPVENWDRYEFQSYLGGGGMGRVYKAYDPKLNRKVALKFLSDDDPLKIARFQNEAKAQARINHECICEIYEVGEVEGKTFIAMQYINGQLLHNAAQQMTLEQKLIVIRDLALALHESHRLGLIHRDIKPDNIMVERKSDGSWRPYIMDFGLAKEVNISGLTETGMIMGTPLYMAPEQARGDVNELDRRTDVYGLGATFYEILVGKTLFDGKTYFEVLFQVQNQMPKEMSLYKKDIPRDIQIITSKCLMKEKNKRFSSARELAEDINRYLDGEPIKARPVSLVYRLQTLIRKYKLAFSVGAIASILIFISLGWGLYTRWRADIRENMIQTFGEKIEKMEAIARYSKMMPVHPIEQDSQKVYGRMSEIRSLINEMGEMGEGPGNYALGKGYLALGDYNNARKHLELAWNNNYQGPRVAYALGTLFGKLYQTELTKAEFLSDQDMKESQIADIEKNYRQPAINYLNQSKGVNTESPKLLEALLAFLNEDYDGALNKTREAYQRMGWLQEAYVLEGDIFLAQGNEFRRKGHYEQQVTAFEKAGASYDKAIQIARSDPSGYEKKATLNRTELSIIEYEQDGDPFPVFEAGLANLNLAQLISSGNAKNIIDRLDLYSSLGSILSSKGEDPLSYWSHAIEIGQKAVKDHPNEIDVHLALGRCYLAVSIYKDEKGIPYVEDEGSAKASFKKAQDLAPTDTRVLHHIAFNGLTRARTKMQRGENPIKDLDEAIDTFIALNQQSSENNSNLTNLGAAYLYKAQYKSMTGNNPVPDFQKSLEFYETAIKVNPNHIVSYNNMGETAWSYAEYILNKGKDPSSTLQRASEAYQAAIAIRDDQSFLFDGLAITSLIRATYELEKGLNPWDQLEKAISNFNQSIQLNESNMDAYVNLAECYWTQAKYVMLLKENVQPTIQKALELYEKANQLNASDYYCLSHYADSYRIKAEWELENDLDPNASIEHALNLIDKAIQYNSNDFWSYLIQGKIRLLQVNNLLKTNYSIDISLDQASRSLKESQLLNPSFAETQLVTGKIAQINWKSQKFDPSLYSQAVQATERALDLKEDYPEALLQIASLLFEKAQHVKSKQEKEKLLNKALQNMELVFSKKPILKNRYEPLWLATQEAVIE